MIQIDKFKLYYSEESKEYRITVTNHKMKNEVVSALEAEGYIMLREDDYCIYYSGATEIISIEINY